MKTSNDLNLVETGFVTSENAWLASAGSRISSESKPAPAIAVKEEILSGRISYFGNNKTQVQAKTQRKK